MSLDRIITNARLEGQAGRIDIGISGGRIAAIEPEIMAEAPRFELEEVRAVGGDVLHRWRRGGAASR